MPGHDKVGRQGSAQKAPLSSLSFVCEGHPRLRSHTTTAPCAIGRSSCTEHTALHAKEHIAACSCLAPHSLEGMQQALPAAPSSLDFALRSGAMSTEGLPAKKPSGFRAKPHTCTSRQARAAHRANGG